MSGAVHHNHDRGLEDMSASIDPSHKEELRRIMGRYATGAAIVTATHDGTPCGLAVNSLTSVSLEPPLVLFCPAKRSETWPSIERAGHFAVNILGSRQQELCRLFSRKGADRFADIGYTMSASGSPVLDDVIAYLECRIDAIHDAGDHFITVGEVLTLGVKQETTPLVFYDGCYHELAVSSSGS
ncbi:MAG: 3-hydroxy-9,10-secoandrosta,3,5(10)-triene-9,17-dione monooxygenase reductase component [Solirubrobacteraceae bacterium]|jgi:flavin reductase (DIM6/NTAB) family NADH-FMN oxidoreductase RutF|nr:3-hydroxy-9,10-secoandrosta,3,5(10)-triene-9,17-dione monooxygenase reductase component [Solirubrobacteraceae bacterium]